MINPYLAASNGASVEAHLGKHLEQILGEVGIQVGTLVERVFSTNAAQMNWQIAGVVPKDTREKHWFASYFPVSDSRGKVTQVAAIVVDLDFPTAINLNAPPTWISGC